MKEDPVHCFWSKFQMPIGQTYGYPGFPHWELSFGYLLNVQVSACFKLLKVPKHWLLSWVYHRSNFTVVVISYCYCCCAHAIITRNCMGWELFIPLVRLSSLSDFGGIRFSSSLSFLCSDFLTIDNI